MIEAGLFQFLRNEPTVNALVGGRIFGVMLPKTPAFPAIVYAMVASVPIESLAGDNPTRARRFQFDCYADTYQVSRQVSNAVRRLLVPLSDSSGTTTTTSYTLPEGTRIQSARCIHDFDKPYEIGGTDYIFSAFLDILLVFVEP